MRTSRVSIALLLLVTLLLAPLSAAQSATELETLYEGLEKPVSLLSLETGEMLLSSLDGRVYLLNDGEVRAETVIDLTLRVTALVGEQGFYGVALEPAAAAQEAGRPRWLVASFAERDTGDLVIAAFPYDEASHRASIDEERILLAVPMPEPFHYGGQVRFGPDGMLWVSVGNGESSNSFLHERPFSAQDLSTLRGKLLRIDLSGASGDEPYRVPDDNPFVGVDGARGEIYAYGFRNPWKFTFHPGTGDIYLVDVGNDRWEEINVVMPGGDHGWPRREGFECQALPDAPGLVDPECEAASDVLPVWAYGHLAIDPDGGQAITGGVVVTDAEDAHGAGRFYFADFVVGRIWALDIATGEVVQVMDSDLSITELTAGPNDEILVVSISGEVARLPTAP